MDRGYIKTYRSMLDNPVICKDSDYFAVWMYLLLNATHKEKSMIFQGEKITLYPGQLITGRKRLADSFHISESKIQRILKAFEKDGQISQQTGNRNRLITILNWGKYQNGQEENRTEIEHEQKSVKKQKGKNQKSEQQANNKQTTESTIKPDVEESLKMKNDAKRTTSEQPVNTNKNVKNERIKEYKRENREKENLSPEPSGTVRYNYKLFIPPILSEVQAYCREINAKIDCEEFLDHYTSNCWYTSGGRRITDWKYAVRAWERRKERWQKENKRSEKQQNTFNQCMQRDYDFDALERQLLRR